MLFAINHELPWHDGTQSIDHQSIRFERMFLIRMKLTKVENIIAKN